MGIEARTSSTTAGGTANATSLGGSPSATGPSSTKHAFWDTITTAQNDAGHTDYRAVFVYNNTANVMNDVEVGLSNAGGGSTVSVIACSVAAAAFASYAITVIGSETTAPAQVTGSYASSVNVGTLAAGQVKAVWLKRVQPVRTAAVSTDNVMITVTAQEVVPA